MPAPGTTAGTEGDAAGALTIRLLGPVEIFVHGQPLPRLRSRKGLWLLALLTLRSGAPVDRAWLAGTLWPDSHEAAAFASLRNRLKDLRRAMDLEAGRLRTRSDLWQSALVIAREEACRSRLPPSRGILR